MKNKNMTKIVLLLLVLFSATQSWSQIRAGAAFLKMLPGARLQSMGGMYTGVFNDPHAIYANPAATGFLREWQWSASYTKWIADIYNASFIYGKNVRNPISRHSRFALGVLYQGVPEFNSTEGTGVATPASASDIVGSISFGQPLTFLSRNISLGANLKYLYSSLDTYSAGGLVYDVGFLARTPRFDLPTDIFPKGILSLGFAMTQLGSDLTYNRVATPLPTTFRSGVAFNTGSHNGFQLLLTTDFFQVKDEKDVWGIGAEISYKRMIALNGALNFGNDLMERFSLGASVRLDDIHMPIGKRAMPGQNNGVRLDFASMNDDDFFSRTYRGSINHFPVWTEEHRFVNWSYDDTTYTSTYDTEWEKTVDPDLYDDYHYAIVMDPDLAKMERLVKVYKKNPDALLDSLITSKPMVKEYLTDNKYTFTGIDRGYYYWAVCAIDTDNHIRMAVKKGNHLARFYKPLPDIKVHPVEMEYDEWITMNDYHGKANIVIENVGDMDATDFVVTISDSLVDLKERLDSVANINYNKSLITKNIEKLAPGDSLVIPLEWHTNWLGTHDLVVDASTDFDEWDKENNKLSQKIYTIPKGQLSAPDTANVLTLSTVEIHIPIVTKVTFDENDTEINKDYLTYSNLDPHLSVIATRMLREPWTKIELQGFSDPHSETATLDLANRRAEAVKDTLLGRGILEEQISIKPGEILPPRRLPSNKQDERYVLEERRYVHIKADTLSQQILFAPLMHTDKEAVLKTVKFPTELKYGIPNKNVKISMEGNGIIDSVKFAHDNVFSIKEDASWKPLNQGEVYWKYKTADYNLFVQDELDRQFKTHPQLVTVSTDTLLRESRIAVPLQFAKTNPLFEFYFNFMFTLSDSLLNQNKNRRIAFQGHACATGPAYVNTPLSDNRVKGFYELFNEYMEELHPEFLKTLHERIDEVKGYGEDDPLQIRRINGDNVILGDNEKSIGRILNRRIEIKIYLKGYEL